MIFDIRPRQTGKTTDLVADAFGGSIIVPDLRQAQEVIQSFNRRGMSQRDMEEHVHTADQWLRWKSGSRGRRDTRVYIDNVDMVLHQLFGDVRIVTAREEEA